MSISNHSVDVKAPTSDLAEQLEGFEKSYAAMCQLPESEVDDSQLEWLESGIELIEDELARREDEDNELGQHYDSPSIQDTLGDRPSYAS